MASTRLEKTFTASNRKTFTISTWIKRSGLTANNCIYGAGTNDSTDRDYLAFLADSGEEDKLYFNAKVSSSVVAQFYTSRRFRDTNAWYHIVLAFDTTQATDTNRMKLYVNGEQQTFQSQTYPSQNQDMNTNNTVHKIGSTIGNNYYFDGSMSHFHFIDGTAYAASDFGSTDSTTGEWKINTSPSVTYGTNGFTILKDGNTITDQSANSNDFTLGGGTLTNTEDNPSNVFATLNPLIAQTGANFLNGNNNCHRTSAGNYRRIGCTLGATSGKYYAEFLLGASQWGGVCLTNGGDLARTEAGSNGYMGEYSADKSVGVRQDGIVYSSGANVSSAQWNLGTISTGSDRLCLALDMDNKKLFLGKNGTWSSSSNPASNTGGITLTGDSYTFCVATSNADCIINTGNGNFANGTTANLISSEGTNASGIGKFEYDVPTGFTALSTKGLNL